MRRLLRRLLIRPGAIGDFVVSLPALESLRADYTEVWCAEMNVPLARFADRAISIGTSGIDRLGVLPADDAIARLSGFDEIVSWYGTNRPEFRALVASLELPFKFRDALPKAGRHAVEFYGGGRFPTIVVPAVPRTFAVIHPFASALAKRTQFDWFEAMAARLGETMPVRWLAGPEEVLLDAVRIPDLYDLACWLAGARVYVGNDSGISHLATAVGTPVLAAFQTTNPKIWSPRGLAYITRSNRM